MELQVFLTSTCSSLVAAEWNNVFELSFVSAEPPDGIHSLAVPTPPPQVPVLT